MPMSALKRVGSGEACAITVVAVVTLKETKGVSLREVDAVDARKHGLEPVAQTN